MARKATPSTPPGAEFVLSALKSSGLRAANCHRPFSFIFHSRLRLMGRTPAKKPSDSLWFHLDTCAFASAIPEQWLDGEEDLRGHLGPLTDPVGMRGIGGADSGPLARRVPVQFLSDVTTGHVYHFDLLVLRSLNRKKGQEEEAYGLIALRDIANNFLTLEAVGKFVWDDDLCIARPSLKLVRPSGPAPDFD